MGRVSVVLITWNSARWLPRCLEAVAAQTEPDLELVVIDNASSDGSADLASRLAPDARVIRNGSNRGFAAAANQGIALTSGEFVALINPDCRLAPGYLELLASELTSRGDSFGAATGKLLRGRGEEIAPTDVIDSRGVRMTRSGRHLDIDSGRRDSNDDVPMEVFGVSGAAAVYRRTFLRDVALGDGAFDEDFFAYREDADLAWRGRLRGWRALYEPRAVGWHVRQVTPAVRRDLPADLNFYSVRNRFLLRINNAGAGILLRHLPWLVARDLVVVAATLTVERSSLPAWGWLWRHRHALRARRRTIQSRRTLPDRELLPWFRHAFRGLSTEEGPWL